MGPGDIGTASYDVRRSHAPISNKESTDQVLWTSLNAPYREFVQRQCDVTSGMHSSRARSQRRQPSQWEHLAACGSQSDARPVPRALRSQSENGYAHIKRTATPLRLRWRRVEEMSRESRPTVVPRLCDVIQFSSRETNVPAEAQKHQKRIKGFVTEASSEHSTFPVPLLGPHVSRDNILGLLVLQNTRARVYSRDWIILTAMHWRCLPANHGHSVLELPNSDWPSRVRNCSPTKTLGQLYYATNGRWEPRWLSGQTARLPPRPNGFNPRQGHSRISASVFSRGSPVSRDLALRRCSILTSFHPLTVSRTALAVFLTGKCLIFDTVTGMGSFFLLVVVAAAVLRADVDGDRLRIRPKASVSVWLPPSCSAASVALAFRGKCSSSSPCCRPAGRHSHGREEGRRPERGRGRKGRLFLVIFAPAVVELTLPLCLEAKPRKEASRLAMSFPSHFCTHPDRLPPTGSIPGRVTPDFPMRESCRTMPLVGGFSRGSPVSHALTFWRCSHFQLASPISTLSTSLLRAAQISPFAINIPCHVRAVPQYDSCNAWRHDTLWLLRRSSVARWLMAGCCETTQTGPSRHKSLCTWNYLGRRANESRWRCGIRAAATLCVIFTSQKVTPRYNRGAAVAERLARTPPPPPGQGEPGSIPRRVTPDFRKWESCRTMPLVGGSSRGSPASPAASFRRRSIFTIITPIGSRGLAAKDLPNLFTHVRTVVGRVGTVVEASLHGWCSCSTYLPVLVYGNMTFDLSEGSDLCTHRANITCTGLYCRQRGAPDE
ncbi:hypothetical protein PR048_019186 [Dryococelus australis]|uniref:Uncharacterized protein n=1 Tax=Dryococelus australis TaxID=614101 RepID=A0ABQ9H2V5_9NEOP|nr:hypothetical protein PR048_019186 [Dryococelus australis]